MNGWGYVPLLYSDRIGGGDGIGNREAFAETFFRDCGGSGIGGDKVGISSNYPDLVFIDGLIVWISLLEP